MLQEVSGDILLSKASLIAHGVAPNDDHASGLAHALREYAPAMYKDFRHYCKTQHPKAGSLWAWAGADGRRIVALFTQEAAYNAGERPGRATLANVNHTLHQLRRLIEHAAVKSVALPRLATGVGGLSWADVRPSIEKALGNLTIPVIVYSTYHAGQVADEKL
ncbi:MAG TPA: macro domain-containing protein [Steroidobacteraceae bacterium]|nr:macro domain-containing protein [Steroidobacteraceae bacterium]